jgi:hypothetical protein
MKNIETLIADGGSVSLDALAPHDCVAVASDHHDMLAALVRREGESLAALLKRLDRALGRYYDDGETVDEINES